MRSLLAGLFLFLAASAYCQETGWDAINANDFVKAKQLFQSDIKKDSTNLQALRGLIVLSEFEANYLDYNKHVGTLLRNHPIETDYNAFKASFRGDPHWVLDNKPYSIPSLLNARFENGRVLKKKRKFDEAQEVYRSFLQDFNWSMCGPFLNRSGSAHIKSLGPEGKPFDSIEVFNSQEGKPLEWVQPAIRDHKGKIYFEDHLPSNYGSNCYYANTYFKIESDTKIQLRLHRNMPIKLWLDQNLVFASDERVLAIWDNEIIEVEIEAGLHRLMVKSSDFPIERNNNSFLRFTDPLKSGNLTKLAIRITDQKGELLQGIEAGFNEKTQAQVYDPIVQRDKQLAISKELSQSGNAFDVYRYCKDLFRFGYTLRAEEEFVEILKSNPTSVFLKVLLAKAYAANLKTEKAYETLSKLDSKKTPIFSLLYKNFSELDMENDEEQWLISLKELEEVCPSSYSVIDNYAQYYDTKGQKDKEEKYLKDMIKKFPSYKLSLEYKLKSLENKPSKHVTDKDKKKKLKESQANIKTKFDTDDYRDLIEHYKDKDNFTKTLDLYNELILYMPYSSRYRLEKAEFLYENEKLDEALQVLEELLTVTPMKSSALEVMGDIYLDKEDKENALKFYQNAALYSAGWQLGSINKKIEKIVGQKKLKRLFETKSFEEIVNQRDVWEDKYKDDDAIILLYTRDVAIDSANAVEIYQKMMIQVQSEVGVNAWTEYDFGFMGQLSSINVIKKDGTKVRPEVGGSYVVCKNLEPGDRIEVEGSRSESKWKGELGDEIYMYNYISFEEPLFYSKLEIAIDDSRELNYIVHKSSPTFEEETKEGFHHYTWTFNEIPQVYREYATIDGIDLYAYVMVSTMPDWQEVSQWYRDKTYKLLELTYEVKEIIDEVITPQMTDQEKVVALYDYITSEIKYSYVSFLQSNYIPKKAGLTCASKIGDCKDVATLMIGMLQYLNIDAWYTLVKTSHYHRATIVPSLYFDHVIVGYKIDDEVKYLDLTTDYYPHNVITNMDVDAVALHIKEGEKNVFRLPNDLIDPRKNTISAKISGNLYVDRSIDLKIETHYPGMAGGYIRETFSKMNAEERRNHTIDNVGNGIFDHVQMHDLNFANLDNIDDPLKVELNLTANTYADHVLNFMVFRIPYETTIQYDPVIGVENRYNSLDLSYITEMAPLNQEVTLGLPKGYSLVETPKNIEINSKFGKYSVDFTQTVNGLKAVKRQQFLKQIILPEEFKEFKEFYLSLLDADATLIALRK